MQLRSIVDSERYRDVLARVQIGAPRISLPDLSTPQPPEERERMLHEYMQKNIRFHVAGCMDPTCGGCRGATIV